MTARRPPLSARENDTAYLIEIGSNSVRFLTYQVLFDSQGTCRWMPLIHREKSLCHLGRHLMEPNPARRILGSEDREQALKAVTTYAAHIRSVENVFVIATAATRNAANGPAFRTELTEAIGHDVTVIEDQQEAVLGRRGVLYGEPRAQDAVVVDLGGGSLEIQPPDDSPGVSLPIGALSLATAIRHDSAAARRHVQNIFAQQADMLRPLQGKPLVLIGGMPRALAEAHLNITEHPLPFVQGHEMTTEATRRFFREIATNWRDGDMKTAKVSTERQAALPASAWLLAELLGHLEPCAVAFSAFGLREGFLSQEVADFGPIERDPALFVLECESPDMTGADTLTRWLLPLLPKGAGRQPIERLARLAALWATLPRREWPNLRAEAVLHEVASKSMGSLTHEERAFLAIGMYVAERGKPCKSPYAKSMEIWLKGRRNEVIEPTYAQAIGLGLALAREVGAGQPANLKGTALAYHRGQWAVTGESRPARDESELLQRLNRLQIRPEIG